MNAPAELPITEILPALRASLAATPNAVLQAPPGAGKTTGVPLALLHEAWLRDRRIIMLEPRRLAARAAATRMAAMLGEAVGQTIGYRVRLDTRISRRTRIEIVTDGIFTRMIQEDPSLDLFGAVIFDEFHERRLDSDLGLALALDSQAALRPDLRLIAMSATLDAGPVARLMGDAPILTASGRAFPVALRHLEAPSPDALIPAMADAVELALEEPGGILVFLPGGSEIRRGLRALAERRLPPGIDLLPLHGEIAEAAQAAALAPSPVGRRKIVLATSIAETSLTIDGIRQVVDCGLARQSRYDPRSGMTRLETKRVSQAGADQRAGRAGRVAPGICWRLWPEAAHKALAPRAAPEIALADLTPLALELAEWGITDPAALRLADPPPAAAFAASRRLLLMLGAIDAAGRITPHGRAMAALGMAPRLAHMVIRGAAEGEGPLAATIAAILSEHGADAARETDLRSRLERVAAGHDEAARRIGEIARRLMRQAGIASGNPSKNSSNMSQIPSPPFRAEREGPDAKRREGEVGLSARTVFPPPLPDPLRPQGRRGSYFRPHGAPQAHGAAFCLAPAGAGALLALAYPDRIAQRRAGPAGRFLLSGGQGAWLPEADPLAAEKLLVVADLDGQPPDARIRLATPLDAATLDRLFAQQISETAEIWFELATRSVQARYRRRLGALILAEAALADPEPEAVTKALLDGIRRTGLAALPWSREAETLRARIAFLARLDGKDGFWPAVDDAGLTATLDDWLGPALIGRRSLADLAGLDLARLLQGRLDPAQRRDLERRAPSHWVVPSGSNLPIDYRIAERPVLAVRLQELFGAADTPAIAEGRVPLTLELLSPAGRPIQVTQDLGGFWRGSYRAVRADLRGRYPRHPWPEDPLQAMPTARAKPRGT